MSQDTASENASGRQLKKQVDLTEGSPGKSLLMFAFPMILGNLFVMGFEGLLVGIQVLRLEFYELFGRFYGDGGVAYQPKIIDYTSRSAA